MEKRRILLIGDLRPAFNYGAVATSDVLISRIRERLGVNDELRIIDYRSFFTQTPVHGLPEWTYPRFRDTRRARRRVEWRGKLKAAIRNLKRRLLQIPKQNFDPLPARWRDFPAFARRVLGGEIYRHEKRLLEWADLVVINSEGNIVNGIEASGKYRRGARYVFAMAYLAQVVFRKPTTILNFTVDPKNPDAEEIIRELFPKIERLYPREPLSVTELDRIGVKRSIQWFPDILFSRNPDPGAPDFPGAEKLPRENYICLGDSSGLFSLSSKAKWDVTAVFTELITRIRNELGKEVVIVDGFNELHPGINEVIRRLDLPYVSLPFCSYGNLIKVLGRADLFISGRWHASIIAALSGTPFLLWGSDSHKTRALGVMFESPYHFFHVDSLPIHLDDLIENASAILAAGPGLREEIRQKAEAFGEESLHMLDFINPQKP
jgi:hypothetical protein